ncbi:arginase [Pyrenophora seminiperda CCB06]|uniref:Arginase n=1 Tax=Pyrenophora seminiperda CCB06 TaxID=1302712 RepID=A0A3M7MCG0_9PLEO|nr:arginase [Pyrenophora seminiperda CCB06]
MTSAPTIQPKFLPNRHDLGIVAVGFSGGQPKAGVDAAPMALIENGLIKQLEEELDFNVTYDGQVHAYTELQPADDPDYRGMKRPKFASAVTKQVSDQVYEHAKSGKLVLTLGGDHSIAIGTVSGTAKAVRERLGKDIAVIWVDAHADINTPETSDSGNIHGMPVSFLTGLATEEREDVFGWIKEEHRLSTKKLVYIGLRDIDKGEKKILREHDPMWAPSTGTPVRGGLTLREGDFIAECVAETGSLIALDLVEVNPSLDAEGAGDTVRAGVSIVRYVDGMVLVDYSITRLCDENVLKMAPAVFPDHKSERKVTQTDTAATRSPMRVCGFCVSNILESAASSGQHRILTDGAKTALNQCTFCSSLYANIGGSLLRTENWPLYHWTLRALPRGRELRGSMMLRFWSSHPTLTTKPFRFLPGTDLHVSAPEDLQESTDPKDSGGTQINRWMETYMRDHQGCSKAWHSQRFNASFLPTRLLDVDTGDDNTVRLVDTKITKAKGPYCTLSHAWGGPQAKPPPTTTVWNMAKHLITDINLDELPPNFKQAIQVIRFLKVRYIWIDSLAIVQDPFGDFAREADLMHKVYRYSHCNIVAAHSKHAYGGLFRRRIPHEILPVKYQGTNATHRLGEKTWTIVPADLWEKELLISPIYSRGWVFQAFPPLGYSNRPEANFEQLIERILSPRLLHFTKHQIFWDCGTLSACEVFPTGLPFPLDHKASTDRHWRGRLVKSTVSSNALTGVNDNESSYTFWTSAVQNYTECDLTNQGDKSIAIWSIAKLLRDFMGEQYAVGMWSQALEEQMAWRVRDTRSCERMPELDANIPSWSWASVKGPVVPQHRLAIRSYKVTDHTGAIVKFTVKEEYRQGDKEPVLENRALALKTNINYGRLIHVQEDKYHLQVSNGTSSDAIEMHAFPDTPLATTGIDPEKCAFLILAASATSHNTSSPQLTRPSSPEAYQTYSGIGLLLITHSAWFADQEQLYHEYKSAQAGVKPSREQEWRLNAFSKLMLQQSERVMKMKGQIASVYRRVGALQFRDLDEQAFNALTNEQLRKNIWLE